MAGVTRKLVRAPHRGGEEVAIPVGIVEDADYLIDLHAGEFAQGLTPWIPVPVAANPTLTRAAVGLARGFNVPCEDAP